jgi:hypothetical protein
MRTNAMQRKSILMALIGPAIWSAAAGAFAQTFVWEKPPIHDVNTGLTFGDLAGFKFEKATVSTGNGKGDPFRYAVNFRPPGPGLFQILMSDCGTGHVPDGPDSNEIDTQVNLDIADLSYQKEKGLLDAVESIDHSVVSIGEGTAAPQFRRITSYFRKNQDRMVLDYYFVGYRGYLIAFRAAFPQERHVAGTQDCQRFLAEFARAFIK